MLFDDDLPLDCQSAAARHMLDCLEHDCGTVPAGHWAASLYGKLVDAGLAVELVDTDPAVRTFRINNRGKTYLAAWSGLES